MAEASSRLRPNPSVIFDAAEIVKSIRKAVSAAHDLRVHDVVLIEPRTIAKTSSGKIQRHASKAGYLQKTLDLLEI